MGSFTVKKHGFLVKRLIPELGQGMYKINLECLVITRKQGSFDMLLCVKKDSRGNWKRLPLAKDET